MPTITTDDGVELFYEEAGSGTPIVFVHEYAGDARSWEPQLRFFARRYRCIAYNARGYPPSQVPTEQAKYSQDRATDDIAAVIKALDLAPAHVVGLSMGGTAVLITLAASASYIAVPAAMRLALPAANPAIALTLSLGITFPFNLIVGIPSYIALAAAITR